MGEGVWGGIVKGPVHRVVDAYFNHKTAAGQYDNRDTFLAGIKNAVTKDDYIKFLTDSVGVTAQDGIYLATWWYNEGKTGFWPWLQPIYPILKAGLIKAAELARALRLPLDSHWSSSGHQVEVFVLKSPQQVTRIIMTPWTPAPVFVRTEAADAWMVRRGLGTLQEGALSDDQSSAVVESVTGSVVVWRVWELPDDPNLRRKPNP